MWIALGNAVVDNHEWLVVDRRRPASTAVDIAEYGECRAAIRQSRRGIRFPTIDLIRVAHDGPRRAIVRGYFEILGATRPTWYSCDASKGPLRWQVNRVTVDS
jgi:hypothetical protein